MRDARWCALGSRSLFDSQRFLTCRLRSPWKVPSTAQRRMGCLLHSLAERYAANCSTAAARMHTLESRTRVAACGLGVL